MGQQASKLLLLFELDVKVFDLLIYQEYEQRV